MSGLFEHWPWLLLAVTGMVFSVIALRAPQLLFQLTLGSVFFGVLTAVPVGFTLKAPQFFSLLGLMVHALQPYITPTAAASAVSRPLARPAFPLRWCLPFGLFALSLLPSFYGLSASEASLSADHSPIRLLFNLGFLYLFTLFMLLRIRSPQALLRAVYWGIFSCALSLGFGFLQQVAFYMGRYNPFAYVGKHNSIVDFYGPFLRFAPGTFANEYGEILQTMGFFAFMLLYYPKAKESVTARKHRPLLMVFLASVVIALVLNFTRASWIVFAVGILIQMIYARFSVLRLAGIAIAGGAVLGVLLYVSQQVLEVSLLLQIGARFEELGSPQAHSAGQRLATWALAWDAFLKAPVWGQGLGKFVVTHNVPLQLLAESGVVGFVGFYGLMTWCLQKCLWAYRNTQTLLLKQIVFTSGLGILGCLAFDLTNHGVYHFVLWYCIGLGLAGAACVYRE